MAGLCRPPRTANFLVPLLSAIWCHLHVTTWQAFAVRRWRQTRLLFAVCHCRKTDQMGQLPGSIVGCHVASLPSVADGKEPVAVGGRRQRACILALFSVFYWIQQFSQQIYMTYIDIFHRHSYHKIPSINKVPSYINKVPSYINKVPSYINKVPFISQRAFIHQQSSIHT